MLPSEPLAVMGLTKQNIARLNAGSSDAEWRRALAMANNLIRRARFQLFIAEEAREKAYLRNDKRLQRDCERAFETRRVLLNRLLVDARRIRNKMPQSKKRFLFLE